jgi:hypothetical protein
LSAVTPPPSLDRRPRPRSRRAWPRRLTGRDAIVSLGRPVSDEPTTDRHERAAESGSSPGQEWPTARPGAAFGRATKHALEDRPMHLPLALAMEQPGEVFVVVQRHRLPPSKGRTD